MIQESTKNTRQLPHIVELEQVSRVLLMYCQALSGTNLQICSCHDPEWQLHPTTVISDGASIFLPLYVDRYDTREENFAWYKASATHQAAHIEFGTFAFSLELAATLFPGKQLPKPPSNDGAGMTAIKRFFTLFGDMKLSANIFSMAEDCRIDYLLKQEYPGIRQSYHRLQQESLARHLPPHSLPPRDAFLEILTRIALDSEPTTVPVSLRSLVQPALWVLLDLQSPQATVYDSAAATLRLYEIISTIPDSRLPTESMALDNLDEAEIVEDADFLNPGEKTPGNTGGMGTGYTSLSSVETEIRDSSTTPEFSQEDVQRFVDEEIDHTEVLHEVYSDSAFQVTELPEGAQSEEIPVERDAEDERRPSLVTLAKRPENEAVSSFLYDEWDFRAGCYLPMWCRVREIALPPGNADFFRQTLLRNSSLAMLLRKQFEMLAPQRLKKLRKLQDGEEFDLDAVLESVMERKSGHIPNDKVYSKRIKVKRDIAVVFLIDMSASTAEVIRKTDGNENNTESSVEPITESVTLPEKSVKRRVVDVAKESIALMVSVMELTNDSYGVYGFSSFGRDNVELQVIKDIEEPFSATVESRIDSIRPLLSTRMGPAIRYATTKLDARDTKTKILFMVSDGYPQDRDYGIDSEDKEYALHDTEMAFIEARRKNIVPFCLTIDAAGYDFLKEMSCDIDHEVIRNVESLPQRLSILYKRLTS